MARREGDKGGGGDPLAESAGGSLLGRFGGERPPAAAWFVDALAIEPERHRIAVSGTEIELLTWGTLGQPGLLFLHGNGAHADWWSFIAPFFATDYRCAAISWSGMGKSGWRATYDIATFADEALAAIDAAGLDTASAPILIGHSFGGMPLMYVGAHQSDRIAGGIMVDSFVPPPDRKPRWTSRGSPTRRYASEAEILERYRFAPEQTSAWPEIVDHIARGSTRYTEADSDGPPGWTWRFDPGLWAHMDRSGVDALVEEVRVPIALIYGAESALVSAASVAAMRRRLPHCPIAVAIPHARHHVMVDEPIALVAALRVAVQAITALGNAS